jgi:tetratricopeptide (TPR) repeat protein
MVAAALLVPVGAAAFSSSRLQAMGAAPRGAQVLYLPSGKYLKVTSLGFPEVMADLIYIWSIQYYSNYEIADRFKYLEHIYGGVISELDPAYIDPYLIGSLIMSTEAGDHEMALRLLDKGMAANPQEWILPFEAGFTCYNLLHDYTRAARYFEKAVAIPGAPGVIRRLRAEMYNKSGDKRSSLEYWREVLAGADNDYVRDVASRHVHDLAIEVDLESLRAAVGGWREKAGSNPPDLEALVRAGLIAGLPSDPEGKPYLYDRLTGEVTSQSRFSLRRKS